MPRYYADSPESITEIFDREGDALRKSGFAFPDMDEAPEEAAPRFGVGTTQETDSDGIANPAKISDFILEG